MAAIIKIKGDSGIYINGALVETDGSRATLKIVSEDARFLRSSECLPEDLPETPLLALARRMELLAKGAPEADDRYAFETMDILDEILIETGEGRLNDAREFLLDREDYKAFKVIKGILEV